MALATPLATRLYTDPEIFERDKREIFYSSWQCVCHLSEVARPGDYVSFTVVDEKVFVICDGSGQLQAFYNTCRHRGHPLLNGSGNSGKTLVCPYHAWGYDLEGQVINVPGANAEEAQACRKLRLKSIPVAVYCGFVFVSLEPRVESPQQEFADLETVIKSFHPEPERLRFVCETSIQHECNWKISIENYNECYHCPTVHGQSLARGVLDMDGYSIQPHGSMIWHEGKAQSKHEKEYDYDVEHSERAGDYAAYWLWPSVAFCCYPGGYLTVRQWLPLNWRQTIYRYRWFSDGHLADAEVEKLMHWHRDTTGAEDEAVVGKIQEAMESRSFEPSPYILGDGSSVLSEVGVQHFHKLYREVIDVAGSTR